MITQIKKKTFSPFFSLFFFSSLAFYGVVHRKGKKEKKKREDVGWQEKRKMNQEAETEENPVAVAQG